VEIDSRRSTGQQPLLRLSLFLSRQSQSRIRRATGSFSTWHATPKSPSRPVAAFALFVGGATTNTRWTHATTRLLSHTTWAPRRRPPSSRFVLTRPAARQSLAAARLYGSYKQAQPDAILLSQPNPRSLFAPLLESGAAGATQQASSALPACTRHHFGPQRPLNLHNPDCQHI
jgi:hypothetical protein